MVPVPENKGRRRIKRGMATVLRLLALLVLAGTGALGIYNYVAERSHVQTSLQSSVTYGVLLYGVLGLVSALGLIWYARWSLWTTTAWAITCTYVAGTAVLAYGGADATRQSAVTAYVAAALFTAAIVWATRSVTRARNSTSVVE